jgi:hypothetical protein
MIERTKNWFANLSKAGRIGVVGAGIFSLLAVSSALAGPYDKSKTPAICTASTTTTTETVSVPFDKTQVNDANLDKGKTTVTTTGVDGEKTVTNEVTDYSPADCRPSSTKLIKEEVTKQPVAEVTAVGTKDPTLPPARAPAATALSQSSNCSPYYSPCLPIVGDLDCPEVGMRVSVHDGDPYRLDADHDGIGCESN